jgi:hypothetical protein
MNKVKLMLALLSLGTLCWAGSALREARSWIVSNSPPSDSSLVSSGRAATEASRYKAVYG